VVGGLAFGMAGAVIGGLSGRTVSRKQSKRVDLKIVISDMSNPVHVVNFMDLGPGGDDDTRTRLYREAIETATHWHALLTILMQKEPIEQDMVSERAPGKRQASSVVDELVKLADLKRTGLLTEDEFETQKRKLLSGS